MSVDVLDPPAGAPASAAGPPVPAARRRAAARSRSLARTARRLSGLVIVLAAWQAGASAGLLGSTTPSPAQVVAAAGRLVESGELAANLGVSLLRVLKGLAIGLSAGLVLGLAAGLARLGEDLVDAPVQAVRMLPHLALVPLFIIWFGIGETSKVSLIAVGVVFPLYINVFHGIRGVDERLVESARSCGVGRFGLITKVVLPGALPQILVGLRQALGVAWLSLVVAEQSATSAGIGYLINQATQFMRTDEVFVVLVVYALLGLATDLLVRAVERRALAWRRGLVAR
ncbi:ABC transporter permease [Actinomadura parmotrematis]|uniref:ABC transporter permease n=1 Tax=Actinomadura parmotrematis TaxID=2864039 RepID=A0ABS7G1N2_9ACTN|nr:ABC transporter permease [Actinomadura parmotrematis]MBW8486620.1 ABC transporter permease [Actinomadura parmotrematis]